MLQNNNTEVLKLIWYWLRSITRLESTNSKPLKQHLTIGVGKQIATTIACHQILIHHVSYRRRF